MLVDDLIDPLKTALGSFFIDKKHRVMFTAGVIHRHDQIPQLPRHPLMRGTVLMQHHANIRSSWTLSPVSSLSQTLRHKSLALKGILYPCVAPHALVSPPIPTVKVLNRQSLIPVVV